MDILTSTFTDEELRTFKADQDTAVKLETILIKLVEVGKLKARIKCPNIVVGFNDFVKNTLSPIEHTYNISELKLRGEINAKDWSSFGVTIVANGAPYVVLLHDIYYKQQLFTHERLLSLLEEQ